MTTLRQRVLAHRRWLMLAVLVSLCARVLVPAGWMPVAGAAGVRLVLCDGAMPMPAAMPAAMPMKQGRGLPQHHQGAPDHPCVFAAAAMALDQPLPTPPLALPAAVITPSGGRVAAVAIGRGLAAPPPPSTGPPRFA